jgi:hypothetical protein
MRLDPEISAQRLVTFLTAATTMITDFCRITGKHRIADLARTDLATLRPDVARRTDLEYML